MLLRGSSCEAGPMKEDFEKLGLEVSVVDTTSASFLEDLQAALQAVWTSCGAAWALREGAGPT